MSSWLSAISRTAGKLVRDGLPGRRLTALYAAIANKRGRACGGGESARSWAAAPLCGSRQPVACHPAGDAQGGGSDRHRLTGRAVLADRQPGRRRSLGDHLLLDPDQPAAAGPAAPLRPWQGRVAECPGPVDAGRGLGTLRTGRCDPPADRSGTLACGRPGHRRDGFRVDSDPLPRPVPALCHPPDGLAGDRGRQPALQRRPRHQPHDHRLARDGAMVLLALARSAAGAGDSCLPRLVCRQDRHGRHPRAHGPRAARHLAAADQGPDHGPSRGAGPARPAHPRIGHHGVHRVPYRARPGDDGPGRARRHGQAGGEAGQAFPDSEIIIHQEPAGISDQRLDHRIAASSPAPAA